MGNAVVRLEPGLVKALEAALRSETNDLARMHLSAILENVRYAEAENVPVCEDTGIQTIFLDIGTEFPIPGELIKAVPDAVRLATEIGPLRPNTVNPFTGRNNGDNLGPNAPAINISAVEGDCAVIHLLPKGGGSEQLSALWMLAPADGIGGLKREVLTHIQRAGGRPCPPVIVGIGIGGGADTCMRLAKRSLLRRLGTHNAEPGAAGLEIELLESINRLGVGPMGMGGRTTALAVNVEFAPRHPATFPVGLVMQCWCHRHATLRLDRDGKVIG